jgi:16S rRNA (cytosine1402-N4)-methyltransferase
VRDLARVLRDYGEVSRAGALAAALDEERGRRPIRTTLDLVAAMERRLGKVSPGLKSKVLQAFRIESNDELGEISRGLEAAARALRPGGVLAVIAYQSLEDRIVKRALRPAPVPRGLPVSAEPGAWVEVTRKPIRPSSEEVRVNARARSARLRVARRRGA